VPIAPSASSKPWLMMVPSKTAAVTLAGIDPDAAFYALRHADVSRTQGGRAGEGRGGPWRGTSRGMIEADHAKLDRAYERNGVLTLAKTSCLSDA
jgi:hypothetical protein